MSDELLCASDFEESDIVHQLIAASENRYIEVTGLCYRAAERLAFLEKKHEEVMDEIHRLRSLENSPETDEKVLSELLLGLNKLCGT